MRAQALSSSSQELAAMRQPILTFEGHYLLQAEFDSRGVDVSRLEAHECGIERESTECSPGEIGAGVAAIQLAKRAGATVLATASSNERLERLKPLGIK